MFEYTGSWKMWNENIKIDCCDMSTFSWQFYLTFARTNSPWAMARHTYNVVEWKKIRKRHCWKGNANDLRDFESNKRARRKSRTFFARKDGRSSGRKIEITQQRLAKVHSLWRRSRPEIAKVAVDLRTWKRGLGDYFALL